jgi:8-oxo-dGTP pyrophosphatase MutT (NUDIX family)
MTRTDYFNDPDAPPANSVVPSASAVITNDNGEVLLLKRRDNNLWAIPGGGHDIGETIQDTAVREVREETGLDVRITGLVGVYTNPAHVMAYTDGEVRQQFSLCYSTEIIGGQLAIDEESTDLAWVDPAGLDAIAMHPSIRLRIDHFLERRAHPYLG